MPGFGGSPETAACIHCGKMGLRGERCECRRPHISQIIDNTETQALDAIVQITAPPDRSVEVYAGIPGYGVSAPQDRLLGIVGSGQTAQFSVAQAFGGILPPKWTLRAEGAVESHFTPIGSAHPTHCPHGYAILIARSVCTHCDPNDLPVMENGWTPREIREGYRIGVQRDAVHWTNLPVNTEYGYCHCKPCVQKREATHQPPCPCKICALARQAAQPHQQESPQPMRRIKA